MPSTAPAVLQDVSDTSIWVAYYRAEETKRPDALIRDPLAELLVGERGRAIAHTIPRAKYTRWTVVMRTRVIDEMILDLIGQGVDTVINLGAGLDTRPYRLDLPKSLHWIEVDQSNIISLKNEKLADQTPRCRLTRVALDLSIPEARRAWLAQVAATTKSAAILTEGVVMYLKPSDVSELAADLLGHPSLRYWIVEYFSPEVIRFLSGGMMKRRMKNAPFLFLPRQWLAFFASNGWKESLIRYLPEESTKLGRQVPRPLIASIFLSLLRSKKYQQRFARTLGFMILQPSRRSAP